MSDSKQNELVGRCGLYCGACVIYRAERDDPEMRKRFAERRNCPPEKVHCRGCGAVTPDCWGYDCKFALCLNEKGYRYCFECPHYDLAACEQFEEFAREYLDDGVDLRANLTMIKKKKTAEWLKLSEKRFRCPHCRKPVVAGASKCHHCRKDIPLP
jgi:Protein of unknown function (DUF3795)